MSNEYETRLIFLTVHSFTRGNGHTIPIEREWEDENEILITKSTQRNNNIGIVDPDIKMLSAQLNKQVAYTLLQMAIGAAVFSPFVTFYGGVVRFFLLASELCTGKNWLGKRCAAMNENVKLAKKNTFSYSISGENFLLINANFRSSTKTNWNTTLTPLETHIAIAIVRLLNIEFGIVWTNTHNYLPLVLFAYAKHLALILVSMDSIGF